MLKNLFNRIRYQADPALRIALVYVFFSFLWILFSDMIVEFFVDDVRILTKIQTLKGWFFVSASGLIIYVLIRRSINDLKKIRKSLDKAVAFHQTLFEQFPMPIYQMEPDGKIVYLNSKCKSEKGLNRAHLLDNVWLKYIHPDDQHLALEKYRKAILDETSYNVEFRLLQDDGSYKWHQDIGAPIYSSTGHIKGFISSCAEIHEKIVVKKQLEDALEAYSNLFLNNPHPMFVYNTDNCKILEVNNSAVELYGYLKEELLGLNIKVICGLTDHEKSDAESLEKFLTECNKHTRKDGKAIYVSTYIKPLSSYKENNAAILAVNDITESKKTFDELLESEKRFKTLFNTFPDVNLVLSKQLVILDANKAASDFFKKSINKIKGMSLYDIFDEGLNDTLYDFFEDIDKNSFSKKNISSKNVDNKEFFGEIIGFCFKEKGSVRYFFSLKDVSDKIEIHKALQESERMRNTLIDNYPGMVYRCSLDPHYTMEFVSSGCYKLTGYRPAQIENNSEISFGSIIHPEDRIRIWDEIQHKIYTHATIPLIYKITTSTNEVKWVLDQVKGVFDKKNKLLFLEGFISDITEEKNTQDELTEKMKELIRINSELERFTYTVSHDLRSPLVTIKGFIDLVRENAKKGNIKQIDEDVNRIINATDKMHYLLEDLLQLSRIGKMSKDFAEFSMNSLIVEVLALLQGLIEKSNAEIIVEKGLPDVKGDRSRIGEVWQNLIENAIKFNSSEKPIVKIGMQLNPENQVEYFVEDNGIGIEKGFHEKIFGLFNKLDPKTDGTGVGLAIVCRIVEIHGGKIRCESEGKNKGAKFLFTIDSV